MTNPFRQSERYTQLLFQLPANAAARAELYFDDIALSVATFEDQDNPAIWQVEIVFEQAPEPAEIERRLQVLAESCRTAIPDYQINTLQQADWVDNLREFPPLTIGRFFVHGSHITDIPYGKWPLQVDAGAAFGSGEHATTVGCLLAWQRVMQRQPPRKLNVLDMGCGSAILGMAAAKQYPTARVLAVDIDQVSVRVANENIRINRLHSRAFAAAGNGYTSRRLLADSPYDIIFANILARPLMQFARHLKRHLAPGGVAILSGLLASQERMVLQAHRMQGMKLKERIVQNGWATLVIE